MLSKRNIREEPQRITLLRRLSSKILLKLRLATRRNKQSGKQAMFGGNRLDLEKSRKI